MVVLVNQLWVSSDPRPYNQKPPAHRREASVASSLLPLFSGFPLFPKKPGRSFVPFFLLPRSNPPRLGLVRNAFARSTTAHHSLSFPTSSFVQRQLNTSRSPCYFAHSVVEPILTHPIHRANHIICATPLPACRNIGVRGCCRNNWLARNPAKPTSLQTISQSPSLPLLETPLNIFTLNDRQIGS